MVAKGTTGGSRISFVYLSDVKLPPAMTTSSVCAYKLMPPQTIIDPSPKLRVSAILHRAKRSPGRL